MGQVNGEVTFRDLRLVWNPRTLALSGKLEKLRAELVRVLCLGA